MSNLSVRELVQETLRSDLSRSDLESLLSEYPQAVDEAGKFWADGFAASRVQPWVARFLVEHGAPLSIHAAAGFGFADHIANMLGDDPSLIHAKGGDGCAPLHFARDLETARLLIAAGADIDARDDDHDSTPAQWLIRKAPEAARLLLDLGAKPDIFLATALGDRPLVSNLISGDQSCTAHRIGRLPDFPPIGHRGRGGTILQWTLAFNSYSHQIALAANREDIFDLLYENSDPPTRLLVCCVLARRQDAEEIARKHPGIVAELPEMDLELLPRYCWETNINYEAVRLMLDLGFPITQTERSHGYSSLHNAAWAGDAALVDLLLSRGHPVDLRDPAYNATPLGYALHDCLVEKRHPEGNFARVVESLLKAGSPWDHSIYPTGNAAIDAVLKTFCAV
jgi:ankyrin repeat protein